MQKIDASNSPEGLVSRVFDAYRAAIFAKDVGAFVALYAEDVRIFELWETWSHSSVESWRAMAVEWFDGLGEDHVVVEMAGAKIHAEPGLVIAHAFLTYRGVSAIGLERRAMTNRLTWVLQPVDGEWKIVHEHTSAPVSHETLKVILKR